MKLSARGRDAAVGAAVAFVAGTLFIILTFMASWAAAAKALKLVPAALGYALLVSWFVLPLGAALGLQLPRIAGDGRPGGVLLRAAVTSALITVGGSLLFRIPFDLFHIMTRRAPFHDLTTWFFDYRGTFVYFLWVGLYSFPWIALLAWRRAQGAAAFDAHGTP